ncbi:Uncharacterised protein [Chlamydia abortus]|nr:Uncharacterised protein [Chlamydia abortus]
MAVRLETNPALGRILRIGTKVVVMTRLVSTIVCRVERLRAGLASVTLEALANSLTDAALADSLAYATERSTLRRILGIGAQVVVVTGLVSAVVGRVEGLRAGLASVTLEALANSLTDAALADSLAHAAERSTLRRILGIGAQIVVVTGLVSAVVGRVEGLRSDGRRETGLVLLVLVLRLN